MPKKVKYTDEQKQSRKKLSDERKKAYENIKTWRKERSDLLIQMHKAHQRALEISRDLGRKKYTPKPEDAKKEAKEKREAKKSEKEAKEALKE